LEIGCGTAGLARPFTDLGATYTGIDLDPRVVAGADHSGPWTVMSGDIFELRDSLGPYDVVVASQVLEHLLDPAAFVEVVHGLLRPGGMVHVDVPSHWALAGLPSRMSSALARRQNRYGAITPPHHCMAFSRESLGTLFSSRFSAKTFSASSADGTWGQALTSGLLPSAYFALSRLPRVGNLCVLLGTAV
jgi:SAM-dependent methyltransferase